MFWLSFSSTSSFLCVQANLADLMVLDPLPLIAFLAEDRLHGHLLVLVLRAPPVDSLAFVVAFVFALIYVCFEFISHPLHPLHPAHRNNTFLFFTLEERPP